MTNPAQQDPLGSSPKRKVRFRWLLLAIVGAIGLGAYFMARSSPFEPLHATVTQLAISPDGSILATAGAGDLYNLWDAESGRRLGGELEERSEFEKKTMNPGLLVWPNYHCLAFDPKGELLVAAGERYDPNTFRQGVIRVLKLPQLRESGFIVDHNESWDAIECVAFSPNGKLLATGSARGLVKLWEMEAGEEIAVFRQQERIFSLAFHPDGRFLAASSYFAEQEKIKQEQALSGEIGIYDLQSLRHHATWTGHVGQVKSVAFSPDGGWLGSAGTDKRLLLRAFPSGKIERSFDGHTMAIVGIAFSPDGRTLAAADVKEIKLWDVASGSERASLRMDKKEITTIIYAPSGKKIFVGGSVDVGRSDNVLKVGFVEVWSLEP